MKNIELKIIIQVFVWLDRWPWTIESSSFPWHKFNNLYLEYNFCCELWHNYEILHCTNSASFPWHKFKCITFTFTVIVNVLNFDTIMQFYNLHCIWGSLIIVHHSLSTTLPPMTYSTHYVRQRFLKKKEILMRSCKDWFILAGVHRFYE